ncbi:MAG: class I SAM-dependent methyltransferase [Phycisphaerales bacterium]|nr:class I SAM-dependent methyltransferase [Phycisphaerales bacterium]
MMKFLSKVVNLKFNFLNHNFKNSKFKLLDVGAGNHSATRIVGLFPNCEYHGLDMQKEYSNDENDFAKMTCFYELDLTKLDYSTIPDNYFDVILMSHVIEHLYNGDKVLPILITKLKQGGIFYIEYPSKRSTRLPSMYGTLNFYDDPTHVRIYSIEELKIIFESCNCTVMKSGIRRNFYYIFAMPLRIIAAIIKRQPISGNIFWDILGFAEFLKVRKN